MNEKSDLIDEQELRECLSKFRPDRVAFEAAVRSRLASLSLQNSPDYYPSQAHSPLLQVAASMVPLSLISKTAGAGATIPLGKVSLGYKLVGYAALPALTLLFMVGATLFAWIRIRQAQLSPVSQSADKALQQSVILKKWWMTFGLIPVCLALVALVVALAGYTLPMFVFFLGSGVAMVVLITRLGRAGLVDRHTVGMNLIAGLMGLTQVTQTATMLDSGYHLLDQSLVMLIPMLAIPLILALSLRGHTSMLSKVFDYLLLLVPLALLLSYLGWSLCNPMPLERMKSHVEAFDHARFSSASWKNWAVPTAWLQQLGIPLDLSRPRALLESEIAGEQNAYILGSASRTGLIVPNDFSRIRDPFNRRKQLLDPSSQGDAINSIEQHEYAIRELIMLGQWNDGELDRLESRLLQTVKEFTLPESGATVDALVATQLLAAIGRPCRDPELQQRVQQKLVALQRVKFRLGGPQGGFASYPQLNHSDRLTTAYAVELMEHYGVPPELNVMALRSFLRPTFSESWSTDVSAVRVATKMRLENLPQIPPLTWWDYVRYESSIVMAIVFAGLCLAATLGCPNLPSDRR